jgi:hypothetical protein
VAAEFSIVDVWVGNFESESAFSAYLAETYADDDATPLSPFASDQGQRFYDHDFVERCDFDRTADLRAAMALCSFATSYIDEVVAAYRQANLPSVNAALLAFGGVIRAPKSVSSAAYQLWHLGRFRSDPRSP